MRRCCAARAEASSALRRAIPPLPDGRAGEGDEGRGGGGEVEEAFCMKGDERADGPGELGDKDSRSAPLPPGDSIFNGSLERCQQ
jgi:hypothetical protein